MEQPPGKQIRLFFVVTDRRQTVDSGQETPQLLKVTDVIDSLLVLILDRLGFMFQLERYTRSMSSPLRSTGPSEHGVGAATGFRCTSSPTTKMNELFRSYQLSPPVFSKLTLDSRGRVTGATLERTERD